MNPTDAFDAEDRAVAELAALFVGSPPPADAPMDEQLAYADADAVLDALHPDVAGSGDPDVSRQHWEALAARR